MPDNNSIIVNDMDCTYLKYIAHFCYIPPISEMIKSVCDFIKYGNFYYRFITMKLRICKEDYFFHIRQGLVVI